jgi:hypothetical protein
MKVRLVEITEPRPTACSGCIAEHNPALCTELPDTCMESECGTLVWQIDNEKQKEKTNTKGR